MIWKKNLGTNRVNYQEGFTMTGQKRIVLKSLCGFIFKEETKDFFFINIIINIVYIVNRYNI